MEIQRLYQAAAWYQRLRETSNPAFLPLFADEHRYLVLMGGGGSGKSIFAGRKVLERATSEPGHRFLICRKVARTVRESCWRQLLSQLRQHFPTLREGRLENGADYSVNKSDFTIRFANGSQLIFAGLDDVEKLKSIYELTDIWVEEASELLESDFNQLDIRMRGASPWYRQLILTFNPISITHWLKARFFDRSDPRARTHRSTFRDNRFLSDEDIQTLLAFREADPYYYAVYALGEWGVTGRTVFDGVKLAERLQKHIQPLRQGCFTYQLTGSLEQGLRVTDIHWQDDPQGAVRIYQPPQPGRPYVLGGDTAGDGSDQFAGQVLDNISCQQAAVLHHTYDEDLYTMQMYCLGCYYNQALIGIESNFSSYPNKILAALGYGNLYVRHSEDSFSGQLKSAYGVQTNSRTRPVMIAGLVRALREATDTLNDRATIEEMLTFVRDENFRPAAEAGAHDDLVMALAIAYYIREQADFTLAPSPTLPRSGWTADMWEDYQRGSAEDQREMEREWGGSS